MCEFVLEIGPALSQFLAKLLFSKIALALSILATSWKLKCLMLVWFLISDVLLVAEIWQTEPLNRFNTMKLRKLGPAKCDSNLVRFNAYPGTINTSLTRHIAAMRYEC